MDNEAVVTRKETKAELRERPRTAAMVLESEQWLFTTLRSIGDAVIATDAEGRVVFMNPVAVKLTGWTEEDALGVDCERVFHIVNEDTRRLTESPVAKVIRDGVISGLANHTILIAKDGTERSIDDSGSPIRDPTGKLTGVVLIFRDVTATRTAQRTVLEQRDILQTLFDHIPILVAFMDAEGRFKWVNRELERVLGWQLGELQERERAPQFYGQIAEHEAAGEFTNWVVPGWHDFRTKVRAGTEIDISWSSVPLSDGTVIGIGQVITERKLAERGVADQMALLEVMNERFKTALVETHHRVKNNLQILSALVDLHTIANGGTLQGEDIEHLKLHVRSLAAVHDLLTRDTRTAAHTTVMSAKEALEELMPLLKITSGAEIDYTLDDAILPIRHGMALAVLVNELVTNSVKHGGMQVALRLAVQDDIVQLEVCDDGKGFPADFHAEESANIGLQLVERMTRWDLQGTSAYRNRSDGGACVHISFPLPTNQLQVA